MLAVMDSMGQIMSDILGKTPEEMMAEAAKAAQQAQNEGQEAEKEGAGQNEGGSDGLNSMMGMMVGPMADAMASHRIMTEKTDEFVDAMDIAGYNYMTAAMRWSIRSVPTESCWEQKPSRRTLSGCGAL